MDLMLAPQLLLLVWTAVLGPPGTWAEFRLSGPETTLDLPADFLVGAGSSAFQTEGAWNTSGKGESVWDRFLHEQPSLQNGDVTCDTYHKFKEDVALMHQLKISTYRFSLSWTRLLPNGTADFVNPDGVRFYNELINELVRHNITPVVTVYHFDLPQVLEDLGGWRNDQMVQWFRDYAGIVFQLFGDRVKMWKTVNEPYILCTFGYGGTQFPPALNQSGSADYMCVHNIIRAHVSAYHLYQSAFKHQGGRVGITLTGPVSFPKDPSSTSDVEAAQRVREFSLGWVMDPLAFGDYPASMRAAAGDRLPRFSQQEVLDNRGSYDFVAVDVYSASLATLGSESEDVSLGPSFSKDLNVTSSNDPDWAVTVEDFTFAPGSTRSVLQWLSARYNNLPILVGETGWANAPNETLNDQNRIAFLSNQLREAVLAATEDGCNVLGLIVWSFLDNLEFTFGYSARYGVTSVNFSDPDRARTPKESAHFIGQVAAERAVPYVAWPDQ